MWAFFKRFCSPKVEWHQPRWSYVPEVWREWSRLFQPWFVMRTTVIAALIFGILVAGLKMALPALQLGFLWRAPFAVLLMYGIFALQGALHIALPPSVSLRKNMILLQHGNSHRIIGASSVISTHLTIFAADRIRLRINYRIRDKLRRKVVGVAPKCDLQAICELLPVPPEIRDARERYASQSLAKFELAA